MNWMIRAVERAALGRPRNVLEAVRLDMAWEPLGPCEPLPEAAPGSQRKILELERRVMQGQELHHPLDGTDIDFSRATCRPPLMFDATRVAVDRHKGRRQ